MGLHWLGLQFAGSQLAGSHWLGSQLLGSHCVGSQFAGLQSAFDSPLDEVNTVGRVAEAEAGVQDEPETEASCTCTCSVWQEATSSQQLSERYSLMPSQDTTATAANRSRFFIK
jgi:hypothetical protein